MTLATDPSGGVSLWHAVTHRNWIWIDLVILLVLISIQVLAYWKAPGVSKDPAGSADALRSAAGGGLTVVGILLPLSILAIQLRAGNPSVRLPDSALADFFLAALWLVASLGCGLYVLFTAAIRGPREDVVRRRDVGILFGAQLFFLFVGGFRLVWAITSIISTMLKTPA